MFHHTTAGAGGEAMTEKVATRTWTLPPADDWNVFISSPPPAIDWVVHGLKRGDVGILSAPGGTGKSMFCLPLADAVSRGKDLFGQWPVGSLGDVIYLYADDDTDDLRNRVYYLYQSQSIESVNFGRIHSFNVRLDPPRFMVSHIIDERGLLQPQTDVVLAITQRIISICNNPRLLIIDPLRKFHTLEENSNTEMEQLLTFFARWASELRVALLLVHHTGKSAVLNGQGNTQQSARGASAIVDQARWHVTLQKNSEPDATRYNIPPADTWKYIVAHNAKINGTEPLPDLLLERGPGGVLMRADIQTTIGLKVVHRGRRGEITW